jgi:hypothetical protein
MTLVGSGGPGCQLSKLDSDFISRDCAGRGGHAQAEKRPAGAKMTEPTKLPDSEIEAADKKELLQVLQSVASLSFLQAQKLSGLEEIFVSICVETDPIVQEMSQMWLRKQARKKSQLLITNVLKENTLRLMSSVKLTAWPKISRL